MLQWLRASSVDDVAKFYEAKYAKDGLGAFTSDQRGELLSLLEHLSGRIHAEDRILDAGCGHAEFLEHVARERGCRVVGIDVSPTAVYLATARLEPYGAAFEIPMEDAGARFPEHFDRATCLGALEHTMDPHAALESLIACLKPAGTLLVTVPLLFDGCLSHIAAEPNGATNERFATVDEWLALLGRRADSFAIIGDGESKDVAIAYSKGSA